MQSRNIERATTGTASIGGLGELIGVIERSINEGNKLILTVSSKLGYNDLINKLIIGYYVLIIDPANRGEVMIRINGVEALPNPPPSIGGLESTYVKVIGEVVITRFKDNDTYRYSSHPIIPINGSLLIYPNSEVIRDFLGIRGDVVIGKALINGFEIPVAINNKALEGNMLIIGQPGSGKSLLIKRIVKGLYLSDYGNVIIIDRTGEYVKYLVENGVSISLVLPIDLMRLGRPIDVDELRKYVIDKLRVLGFRSRVKVRMSISRNGGVEFTIDFIRRRFGKLRVYPLSIKFRWFIERAVNFFDPEIKYVVTKLIVDNEKAVSTAQSFIEILRKPELVDLFGKPPINKAIDLAYTLMRSGYFDAVINIGGENIDISIYSPMRALRNKIIVFDIHEMPEHLLNIYETILIEDVIKWFMGSPGNKAVMIIDNAEGLIDNKNLLNALVNSVRVGKLYGVFFIIATRVFSRKLYREFSNVVFMRMSNSSMVGLKCYDPANLLNNEFIVISPWFNINCIKGSVA